MIIFYLNVYYCLAGLLEVVGMSVLTTERMPEMEFSSINAKVSSVIFVHW